jgi:hypothetical protein
MGDSRHHLTATDGGEIGEDRRSDLAPDVGEGVSVKK